MVALEQSQSRRRSVSPPSVPSLRARPLLSAPLDVPEESAGRVGVLGGTVFRAHVDSLGVSPPGGALGRGRE